MAEISAKAVMQLRKQTGVGMMDCKKALQESDGDVDKAVEVTCANRAWRRWRGALVRDATDGLIISYIHPGVQLSVLVEVNCETDFVARTDDFQQFGRDVAMHIAAAQPLAVDRDGIAADVIDREKGIFLEQAKNEGKPENIAEKIVQGRVEKFFQENCLMEQAFVKTPTKQLNS